MESQQIEELLRTIEQERLKLTSARMARNTQIGYGYAWAMFSSWCERMNRPAIPATPETVSLYITDMVALNHRKVSTLLHRAAAIGFKHREAGFQNPVSREVRELLHSAQRFRGDQIRQVRPIDIVQLRKMAKLLMDDGDPRSTRNRAMLITGFASGLRGANLVSLAMDDIEFLRQGVLVRVRKEKQNQEGKGRYLGLPRGRHAATCPVRSLEDWIELRSREAGAVFTKIGSKTFRPLDAGTVLVILKRTLVRAGVDPKEYGAHSLRAGFITSAGEAGATDLLIARQTGHRSMEVLRRYFRSQDAFKAPAAGLLGL
jgi:integrase